MGGSHRLGTRSDKLGPCGVGHSSSSKLGPLCTIPILLPPARENSSSWGWWTPSRAAFPAWGAGWGI